MAKRGRKAKDEFADLNSEWRDAAMGDSEAEIQRKLGEAAIDQQNVIDEQNKDDDYQQKKAAFKYANEGYAERKKVSKLKIKFIKRVLEGRGKA